MSRRGWRRRQGTHRQGSPSDRGPPPRSCAGPPPLSLGRWTARVVAFGSDTYALYLAFRDPRVPWPIKVVLLVVIAYVLSPVDLVPDWIPVLGILDDAIMIPTRSGWRS